MIQLLLSLEAEDMVLSHLKILLYQVEQITSWEQSHYIARNTTGIQKK
jgi:hypothetical protein